LQQYCNKDIFVASSKFCPPKIWMEGRVMQISKSYGVSTIEFVVVFPIALLMLLIVIQLGFVYMAKLALNHATFIAARHGATKGGRESEIRAAMVKELVPFYQDGTQTHAGLRIAQAYIMAKLDTSVWPQALLVKRLSPNADTLSDFGVKIDGKQQIPNDNLQWRSNAVGPKSGVNIQDANLLKIKVVYGYKLKVPLMGALVRAMMCGGLAPMQGWGSDVLPWTALPQNFELCSAYYSQDRIPIESYAIVQMQSPFDDTP
jgi:hypothetical protein